MCRCGPVAVDLHGYVMGSERSVMVKWYGNYMPLFKPKIDGGYNNIRGIKTSLSHCFLGHNQSINERLLFQRASPIRERFLLVEGIIISTVVVQIDMGWGIILELVHATNRPYMKVVVGRRTPTG